MTVACNGMARPMRNSPFTHRRNRACQPRTMAYAAMNENVTAGTTAPMVTTALLMKYWMKSDSMTSW